MEVQTNEKTASSIVMLEKKKNELIKQRAEGAQK